MAGNFVTGVGRIVDLVGGLSAAALLAVFVVGVLVCYFLPESMVSSYAVLFFSIFAGMRVFAGTDSWVWTIVAFVAAGGVFTFFSFIGNVRRGTTQEQRLAYSHTRSDSAAQYPGELQQQRIPSQGTLCRSCGASVESDSRFCVQCGAEVP